MIRFALVIVAGLALGIAAPIGLAGCDDHRYAHHDDIVFEVHNQYHHDIYVEGVDSLGFVVDFGTIFPGEVVTFVLSDFWEGRLLRARCECDGSVIDTELAFDGMHWDVP